MSFGFEFCSKQSDVVAVIGEQTAPESVKAFLVQAASAFKPEALVLVKCSGHLFDKGIGETNPGSQCELWVNEVILRGPKTTK